MSLKPYRKFAFTYYCFQTFKDLSAFPRRPFFVGVAKVQAFFISTKYFEFFSEISFFFSLNVSGNISKNSAVFAAPIFLTGCEDKDITVITPTFFKVSSKKIQNPRWTRLRSNKNLPDFS